MASINLSSPWVEHYRKLEALFKSDRDVKVVYDNEAFEVRLYVEQEAKAEVLTEIVKNEVKFGNVTLKVIVIAGNAIPDPEYDSLDKYTKAFYHNDALSYVRVLSGIGQVPFTYVVFKKEVVQYFSDDLSDLFGIHSVLYQNIAKSVLKDATGVFYCTDVEGDSFALPLGEWP